MTTPVPDLTLNRALHRAVEDYLIDLIRNGELAPGDRVNEAEVARRLQISRTPVREAFVRLIKDGVLDQVPRRGVFVARHTQESLEEVAGLRAVIEAFAARLASARIQPRELERLRRIVEEGAAAGRRGDWLTMEEQNATFHDLLVSCAHHNLLSRVWTLLTPMAWKLVPGTRPQTPTRRTVEDFVQRHRTLIEAVASGDPERAERAAATHVRQAWGHVLAAEAADRRADAV